MSVFHAADPRRISILAYKKICKEVHSTICVELVPMIFGEPMLDRSFASFNLLAETVCVRKEEKHLSVFKCF
jgi:hypothetical protein